MRAMERPWILSNCLLAAIDSNDAQTVIQILDTGFDVDSIILDGKSAISLCIERGVHNIAQILLDRSCSLSLKSLYGECPLHLAVSKGDVEMVELLLKNRADLTCRNAEGKTPLHLACELNNLGAVTALMAKATPTDLRLRDIDDMTPLMFACQFACEEIVKLVLPYSVVNLYDRNGRCPLLLSICNPNVSPSMVLLLLNAGALITFEHKTEVSPLFRVVYNLCYGNYSPSLKENYTQIALLLIDHGCNLDITNWYGQTPLHMAVLINDCCVKKTLVKKLLNAKCDVNIKDKLSQTPLFYACRDGDMCIVDILLKGGATMSDFEYHIYLICCQSAKVIFDYVMQYLKTVKPLSVLCRNVIRKLVKNVEKDVFMLPVPSLVQKFIKSDD